MASISTPHVRTGIDRILSVRQQKNGDFRVRCSITYHPSPDSVATSIDVSIVTDED